MKRLLIAAMFVVLFVSGCTAPEPTATPAPTATMTPEPTATAEPTPEPVAEEKERLFDVSNDGLGVVIAVEGYEDGFKRTLQILTSDGDWVCDVPMGSELIVYDKRNPDIWGVRYPEYEWSDDPWACSGFQLSGYFEPAQ